MSARTVTIRSGDYLAAIVGLAILRDLFHEPEQIGRRADDLRQIATHANEFPFDFDVHFVEEDVDTGYTEWAVSYDAPATNPAIITEEELVLPMFERAPRGRALDVACGTGRHVGNLVQLGFDACGVDATAAMLDRARAKHPGAHFEQGSWDALPFADDEFDVVTCALALCHAPALTTPIAEMARVLRPGGWLVLSDIHPNGTLLGGAAAYPGDGYDRVPFVRNHLHPLSEYFAALRAAGLVVEELHEHGHGEETAKLMPSYAAFPEATVRAFRGAAGIVAWLATKPQRA